MIYNIIKECIQKSEKIFQKYFGIEFEIEIFQS